MPNFVRTNTCFNRCDSGFPPFSDKQFLTNYTLTAKDPKQRGLKGSLGAYRLGPNYGNQRGELSTLDLAIHSSSSYSSSSSPSSSSSSSSTIITIITIINIITDHHHESSPSIIIIDHHHASPSSQSSTSSSVAILAHVLMMMMIVVNVNSLASTALKQRFQDSCTKRNPG